MIYDLIKSLNHELLPFINLYIEITNKYFWLSNYTFLF
jgi:hypothetical protein